MSRATPRITWQWYRSRYPGLFYVIAVNWQSSFLDHYATTDDFGNLVKVLP